MTDIRAQLEDVLVNKAFWGFPTHRRKLLAESAIDVLLSGPLRELKATRSQPVVVLRTQAELDELPVGSVVMALWDGGPLHYVMQKYADGWYGFPSDQSLFPLGSGRQGETVALLWRGGDKARPGVVVELPELSLLICRGCMRYMDYCVKDPCDERAALLAAAAPAVRPGDNIYASNQAQADAVNRFIEREE